MTELQRYASYNQSLTVDNHLLYAGKLLERAAQTWPEHTALICEDEIITYKRLFERSLSITALLKERGIKPRDRVIILYENSIEFCIGYHGIWQGGAIVTPVNNMLHAQEIAHIINNAQPQAIIISDTQYEKCKDILGTIPVIVRTSDIEATQNDTRTHDPQELIVPLDEYEPSALLYTSGTTGNPKGVMLSSHAIIVNTMQGCSCLTLSHTEKMLAALPFFHSYTQNVCIWSSIMMGATVIIVPRIERKALLKALTHKPSFIIGIPQLYGLFCLMRDAPIETARYFISGGDALPDRIRMAFELIYRRKLTPGYGLTETAPYVAVDLDDILKPTDMVGRPMVHINAEIRNEQGEVLPANTVGVLWLKGENLMLGYYEAPEATKQAIINGWFNTGDLAIIRPDQKIVLCGRAKDLIKNKGIKIYPQEIENVLMKHLHVNAAAVVGQIRNDEEVPVAFVASTQPDNLEAELKELCEEHLATYEIPKSFIIRPSLPMTATGKVDKKVLKKEIAEMQK